jgi:hypothetical protein
MKWEYRIERVTFSLGSGGNETEETVRELNGLGEKGWEAISMWDGSLGTHVLLKRQILK